MEGLAIELQIPARKVRVIPNQFTELVAICFVFRILDGAFEVHDGSSRPHGNHQHHVGGGCFDENLNDMKPNDGDTYLCVRETVVGILRRERVELCPAHMHTRRNKLPRTTSLNTRPTGYGDGGTVNVLEFAQACDSFSWPDISAMGRVPISKTEFRKGHGQDLPNDIISELGTLPIVEVSGLDKLSNPFANPRTFTVVPGGGSRDQH